MPRMDTGMCKLGQQFLQTLSCLWNIDDESCHIIETMWPQIMWICMANAYVCYIHVPTLHIVHTCKLCTIFSWICASSVKKIERHSFVIGIQCLVFPVVMTMITIYWVYHVYTSLHVYMDSWLVLLFAHVVGLLIWICTFYFSPSGH